MTLSLHDGSSAAPDIAGTEIIEIDQLLGRVRSLSDRGARFVTATCLDQGDHFELLYHFDADLAMTHIKVLVRRQSCVPSISGIYLAAFLIENEIKELFGVDITDIAIDYHGRLYLTDDSPLTPMARNGSGDPAAVAEAH